MPDHHMRSSNVAELAVDGWQPNQDAVSDTGAFSVFRQGLGSRAILASTHHYSEFVVDALRHVKPMKIGMYSAVAASDQARSNSC